MNETYGNGQCHPRYQAWIAANVPTFDGKNLYDLRGKCDKFAKAMLEAFPELTLQVGFYYCSAWGQQQHFWCLAPEEFAFAGSLVVDPTRDQFPSKGTGLYVHLEEEERPIGKCANCGELIYPPSRSKSCHNHCEVEFMEYLQTSTRGFNL